MARKPASVDQYIHQAAPFAAPILNWVRDHLHRALPGLDEALRWGHPSFDLEGGKIIAYVAAHKHHCRFGFWLHNHILALLEGKKGSARLVQALHGMAKISTVEDLPSPVVFIRLATLAAGLNPTAKKTGPRRAPAKPAPIMPEDFQEKLNRHPAARKSFEQLSLSCRREYLEWIVGAKKAETRQRRILKALDLLSEGKDLNHAYR